ncbi:MAG: hypothetical protein IPL86_01080 [Flavobacteriales bacterium]|nr:hypothetical protein [Flavobacteriales bacterium]
MATSHTVALGQCGTFITAFPSSEGFENAAVWVSGGTANDWAWGVPAHPNINTAGGGLKAWCVGGLSGTFYNNNERSWLESPCFDFSSLNTPRISFKIYWEVERQYDGMILQYSTDGGTTYNNVGAFGEARIATHRTGSIRPTSPTWPLVSAPSTVGAAVLVVPSAVAKAEAVAMVG